jgi:hypothetical protein
MNNCVIRGRPICELRVRRNICIESIERPNRIPDADDVRMGGRRRDRIGPELGMDSGPQANRMDGAAPVNDLDCGST